MAKIVTTVMLLQQQYDIITYNNGVMMKLELLDARNDFIFKKIFGSDSNKDVLLAFLNSTFMEAGEPPLTEITLMNPYTDKTTQRISNPFSTLKPRQPKAS